MQISSSVTDFVSRSSLSMSSVQRTSEEAPVWGNRPHHNETVSGKCDNLFSVVIGRLVYYFPKVMLTCSSNCVPGL